MNVTKIKHGAQYNINNTMYQLKTTILTTIK